MLQILDNLKDLMGEACNRFPHLVVQGVKSIQTGAKRLKRVFSTGDPLTSDYSDIPPPKLPHCVELIDSEGMLHLIEENRIGTERRKDCFISM